MASFSVVSNIASANAQANLAAVNGTNSNIVVTPNCQQDGNGNNVSGSFTR